MFLTNKFQKSPVPAKKENETIKAPILKTVRNRNSALSLKSITRKKEQEETEVEVVDRDSMPKTDFTEVQFLKLWNQHYDDLIKDGKKIIASIIKADRPRLDGLMIHLTLPTDNMKSQLTSHKPKLLKFIRTKLNNYSIDLMK